MNIPHKQPSIFLITGVMASGKSTVSQLLAEQFERGVHLRGDTFRRMIVSGREEMLPEASDEAIRQLRLRYQIAALAAESYVAAGFNVIMQDVIVGDMLQDVVNLISHRPLYVIVLTPDPVAIQKREETRTKKGYGLWTVTELDRRLRYETPHIGLWLDTSKLTPEETVAEIWNRAWKEASVS